MRRLAAGALAALLIATGSARAQAPAPVRAWEASLALATTVEGPADPNPPFDLVAGERFNYPYALRNALTGTTRVEHYRALFLENEYLKVTVLPELGGHLYSCLDKISGREMFYANKTIKKALIGYRGAWAAFGIEFNFPVSHNWMSMSPVSSAIVSNTDGSASIWVGDVNAVFGSSWRVELRLRPGRAVLEQHTTLANQSDARHRYYWWTNAAVQVEDDSRLIYPTHLMATHGFTAVVPWAIDQTGRDLSLIRNQTDGPVSLFTYGTREPFIGVWHPSTRFGDSTRPRTGGGSRSRTTTARTSSCRRVCSGTRRPTACSSRRSRCGSPSTGSRRVTSAASRARRPTPSFTSRHASACSASS